MNKPLAIASTTLLGLVLTACSGGHPSHAQGAANQEPAWAASVGDKVDQALAQASTDLATKDVTLSDHDARGRPLPEAKITPAGGLVINGEPVALTPAQQSAVLAYRRQLVDVAQQGIVIGRQGAKLGITAAGDALAAIFSGQSGQQVRQRVEVRAAGIKAAAAKLCNRMPALRAMQQQLAGTVPAFAPYATLTEKDVTDCRAKGLHDDDHD